MFADTRSSTLGRTGLFYSVSVKPAAFLWVGCFCMTTLSQCEVCIYTMPVGGDRQWGEQQTHRAIRQELVAVGEHWGGDMYCEQSALMEVRHSTRSPPLNVAPVFGSVHIFVSKLYRILENRLVPSPFFPYSPSPMVVHANDDDRHCPSNLPPGPQTSTPPAHRSGGSSSYT